MPQFITRLVSGILTIFLASFLMLSGCGQKGPLFLPDDQLSEAQGEVENKEEIKEESTE